MLLISDIFHKYLIYVINISYQRPTNNDLIDYLLSAYKINISMETIFVDLTNCIANRIKQYDYIMPVLLDISTDSILLTTQIVY